MMKLPERIRIGGTHYNVVVTQTPLTNPYNGRQLHGVTMPDQKIISVWNNPYDPQSTEETFVHECIEAAIDVYDLHYEDPSTGKLYSFPHSAIKTLGVALHQAFSEANRCVGTGQQKVTTH